jgi:hypothetical protein
VAKPEHYYFSSARNYEELDNALDVLWFLWGDFLCVVVTDCKFATLGVENQIHIIFYFFIFNE